MLRSLLLGLFALLCITQSVAAWEKEDYEIFDLVAALEKSEGKGVSFYDFLNVTSSTSSSEVSRQFRKRSRELHPDKNPDRKDAQERYSLLSVIAEILRDDERRKKYHHYYVNGVPTWRGTGYFYTRFRPGLGTALAVLGIVTCLAQYIAQIVTYRLELRRINNFREAAIRIAYGNKPTDVRKKVRVPMSAGSTGATEEMGKKAISGSSGRLIDMVVKGEHVWLLSEGTEFPMDNSTAPAPSLTRTWIPALFSLVVGKVVPKEQNAATSSSAVAPQRNGSKSKRS